MENKEMKPTTALEASNANSSIVADWYEHHIEYKNDYYTQRGNLYRLMGEGQKQDLIKNIVHAMNGIEEGPGKDMAVNLQLCHWFRIDIGLGIAVAKGLEIDLSDMMKQMPQIF